MVHAVWSQCRRVTSIIYSRKVSARLKGKICIAAIRLAVMHGLETAGLAGRQEVDIEVMKPKILRLTRNVPKVNKARNEYSKCKINWSDGERV